MTTIKDAAGNNLDKNGDVTTKAKKYVKLPTLTALPADIRIIMDGSSTGTDVNTIISVKQRSYRPENESNKDFAKRVQLYETTGFKLGGKDKVEFQLSQNGDRLITNFVLIPTNDNFDFFGGIGDERVPWR